MSEQFKAGVTVVPSASYREQFPRHINFTGVIVRPARKMKDCWVVQWDQLSTQQHLSEEFLRIVPSPKSAARITAEIIVEQINLRCELDHGAAAAWCPDYATELIESALSNALGL